MKTWIAALFVAGTAGIGTASAQELRSFCPDRPGLATPACIVDRGHLVIETSALDWTLERDDGERTDMLLAGDMLLRYGVTDTLEIQAGWSAFGTVRTRDRATGAVGRSSGVGDLTVAARRNLSRPDGEGFSAAVMPFVTLPVGGTAIGAGDWAAGVIVPLSFSLNDRVALELTPEVDAAVNEFRHGRHLAYGSVVGLNTKLSGAVSGTIEFQALRDDDPIEHHSEALASLSLAWQPRDDLQFDMGAVAGLNASSPDVQLQLGLARRF